MNRSIFERKTFEFPPASLDRLEQASQVRLGDLVRQAEMAGRCARVAYKRYMPERREDDEYGLIEAAIAGGISFGALVDAAGPDSAGKVRARAGELRDSRVICIDLPSNWRQLLDEDNS